MPLQNGGYEENLCGGLGQINKSIVLLPNWLVPVKGTWRSMQHDAYITSPWLPCHRVPASSTRHLNAALAHLILNEQLGQR